MGFPVRARTCSQTRRPPRSSVRYSAASLAGRPGWHRGRRIRAVQWGLPRLCRVIGRSCRYTTPRHLDRATRPSKTALTLPDGQAHRLPLRAARPPARRGPCPQRPQPSSPAGRAQRCHPSPPPRHLRDRLHQRRDGPAQRVPGCKRRTYLQENIEAVNVKLSDEWPGQRRDNWSLERPRGGSPRCRDGELSDRADECVGHE
jgi:hypothetical protein